MTNNEAQLLIPIAEDPGITLKVGPMSEVAPDRPRGDNDSTAIYVSGPYQTLREFALLITDALEALGPPKDDAAMTRPFIATWVELSEYLTGAMQRTRFQPYLSITENARRLAAQEAFAEVRELIVPMVTTELADRAEAWQGDGVAAAWRDTGYESSIEVWQAEQR